MGIHDPCPQCLYTALPGHTVCKEDFFDISTEHFKCRMPNVQKHLGKLLLECVWSISVEHIHVVKLDNESLWPLQWYKLSLSHMLSDIFHSNCIWHTLTADNIHNNGTGLTAGATGRQGMLTPPRHLIPSPVFPGSVLAHLFIWFVIFSYLNFETDYSSVSLPYHSSQQLLSVLFSASKTTNNMRTNRSYR
jgi:hypothetical protein